MTDGSLVSTTGPDGVRLHVRGALDASAVERLGTLLAEHGAARVDLSRAGGLPVELLRALAAAYRRGDRVVLEQPSPAAARSLRVSGLERVLRVEGWPAAAASDDADEGVAASG